LSMVRAILLCICAFVAAAHTPSAPLVEEYVVDLDRVPEERWTGIVKDKKLEIKALLAGLKGAFKKHEDQVDELLVALNSSLPDEYGREINGIAAAIEVEVKDILMANAFYELTAFVDNPLPVFYNQMMRACTSIVAQNDNGTVYLARNMDYPDPFTAVMIHAVFVKDGRRLYEGTTFASTVGLSTGFVPGGWAISQNARTNPDHGSATSRAGAVTAAKAGASMFPILPRLAMDSLLRPDFVRRNFVPVGKNQTVGFQEALKFYSSEPLVAPGYLTIAGVKQGEGAVITRNATNKTATKKFPDSDILSLFSQPEAAPTQAGGVWFVAETNVDHWEREPWFFDRRKTATSALEGIGSSDINLFNLWHVLSTYPVYNFATIHTDLTCPASGEYRSYKRHGPL